MARYIEAEALKKVMCEGCDNKHLCTESPACETVQQIDAQPTADVAPVVHAHWIFKPNEYNDNTWECSACDEPFEFLDGNPVDNLMGYCPRCGAIMDEYLSVGDYLRLYGWKTRTYKEGEKP